MSVSERRLQLYYVVLTFPRVDVILPLKRLYRMMMCAAPSALAPRPRLALMVDIKLRSGLWEV